MGCAAVQSFLVGPPFHRFHIYIMIGDSLDKSPERTCEMSSEPSERMFGLDVCCKMVQVTVFS